MTQDIWSAPSLTGALDASCSLPGSKSESNRALVLAALASSPSKLSGVLDARDTQLMILALQQLGVVISKDGQDLIVCGPKKFTGARIDCGLAGTVARFLPGLALLADQPSYFYGDEHMSARPIAPLLDALTQLGATIDSDHVPFTLTPPQEISSNLVRIDSSTSSQFISGLLLIAAKLPGGLRIEHTGAKLPSLPHIAMTIEMLRSRGVKVDWSDNIWQIYPGEIQALDQQIEPDLTNAAAFLIAGVISGGQSLVHAWPRSTTQPGDQIRDILAKVGAITDFSDDGLMAWMQRPLSAANFDLTAASELTPVVAGLAVHCEGVSRIIGVGHIRGHETDRLAAITTELRMLGVEVNELADGLEIHGLGMRPQLTPNRAFNSYADHRMVHLGAIMALTTPKLTIAGADAVTKTLPDFISRWQNLVSQLASR